MGLRGLDAKGDVDIESERTGANGRDAVVAREAIMSKGGRLASAPVRSTDPAHDQPVAKAGARRGGLPVPALATRRPLR